MRSHQKSGKMLGKSQKIFFGAFGAYGLLTVPEVGLRRPKLPTFLPEFLTKSSENDCFRLTFGWSQTLKRLTTALFVLPRCLGGEAKHNPSLFKRCIFARWFLTNYRTHFQLFILPRTQVPSKVTFRCWLVADFFNIRPKHNASGKKPRKKRLILK